MREGRTYRRCTDGRCGKRVDGKECVCGSRSATWCFVVDINPPGAPRKQKRGGGFATKGAAVEAMHKAQSAHANGTAVEPSKLTVGAYLDYWLDSVKPPNAPRGRKPIKESTWAERRSRLNNHVAPYLGTIPLQSLTDLVLEQHYRMLETEGGKKREGLSRATVAGVHLVLHAALEDAVRRRPPLLLRNPADGLYSAPSEPEQERAAWSQDELSSFLRRAEDDAFAALWRLGAMAGARRGELLALRWRDLDLASGQVTINRAMAKGIDGQVKVGTPKSKRSRRTIEVDPTTVDLLTEHRRRGSVLSIDGLAFTYRDGAPLHPDGVSQRFRTLVRDVDVRPLSLHGLRHTHATLLLLAGVPLHVVSRRLGHSSEAFTARIYSHVLGGQDGGAALALAALVDG